MMNFPQNGKDLPPKAKFPGNEIPKFRIFVDVWKPVPLEWGDNRCLQCYTQGPALKIQNCPRLFIIALYRDGT